MMETASHRNPDSPPALLPLPLLLPWPSLFTGLLLLRLIEPYAVLEPHTETLTGRWKRSSMVQRQLASRATAKLVSADAKTS